VKEFQFGVVRVSIFSYTKKLKNSNKKSKKVTKTN